jgi:hypothetical protein
LEECISVVQRKGPMVQEEGNIAMQIILVYLLTSIQPAGVPQSEYPTEKEE